MVDIYPWISQNHALLAMLEEILFQFMFMSVVPDYFIKRLALKQLHNEKIANDPPQTKFYW